MKFVAGKDNFVAGFACFCLSLATSLPAELCQSQKYFHLNGNLGKGIEICSSLFQVKSSHYLLNFQDLDELKDSVEMLTLDKEMAEEKAEVAEMGKLPNSTQRAEGD